VSLVILFLFCYCLSLSVPCMGFDLLSFLTRLLFETHGPFYLLLSDLSSSMPT